MNQFLDDLEFYCTASLAPPADPAYHTALEAYCTMEAQIKAAMGADFLNRFAETAAQLHHRDALQAFHAGLRFGANFVKTVWVNPPRQRNRDGSTPP